MPSFRTERDPLGELKVPADAYYGLQTARAVENFPISGLRAHPDLVTATILVKKAAAEANAALRRLDGAVAGAQELVESLSRKADAFAGMLKTGRTHLQDAVPMTLGQEFGGYAECVRRSADELLERSTATTTAFSPYIGYAATAEIAKESVKSGRSIRELVIERGLLDKDRLDATLSADAMTRAGIVGSEAGRAGEAGGAGKAGPTRKAGKS
jgi:aspartate ammonia-lyase